MKSPYHVRHLAAQDACPELVLELLTQLARQDGLSVNDIVSPTAPPPSSTTPDTPDPASVDKSGVPTTTSRDMEDDDDGSAP